MKAELGEAESWKYVSWRNVSALFIGTATNNGETKIYLLPPKLETCFCATCQVLLLTFF